MEKKKLYINLKTLRAEEVKQFQSLIQAGYFHQNEACQQLLLHLLSFWPNFQQAELEKTQVWATLFPDLPFEDKQWRYLCSDAVRLIESFWTIGQLFQSGALPDLLLHEALSEKKLDKNFQEVNRRLEARFAKARLDPTLETERMVQGNSCAAEYSVPAIEVTQSCPFCGSNVVVATEPENRITPNGVLPFSFKEIKGREYLGQWLGSRFWAPNDLKQMALKEGRLRGMYIPYWTYDSDTTTQYTGQRGDHYWETETYTDSDGDTRTRQVQRTAWSFAAGTVYVSFDDVLVLGSDAIPEKYAQRLRTWALPAVVSYEKQYLVGFQSLRYSRDLETCWVTAQQFMHPKIFQ